MKRAFFMGFLLAAGALSGTACGDDDDGDDDGGNGTGGSGMNVECTPGGDGACENDMDCVVVENGEARTTAQTCGLGCQQDMDPGMCAVVCIVGEIEISQGCATCYAALVGCASQNCLAECGADPTSDECNDCQVDSGCRGNFDTCSGLMTAG